MDGHPALEGVATVAGDVSIARAWAAEELSLPMHPDLHAEEVEWVAKTVIEAVTETATAGGARC
jgi:dTDP-4-amino-4,6-dideoxygalactose transaminase